MTDQVPEAPPATSEQRRQALDAAVSREVIAGGRVVHKTDYDAIIAYGGGVGHWIFVLLTAGLWLLAYPWWHERRYVLSVNEIGRVWRRFWTDEKWERVDE